jgi:hypothetical protein
VATHTQEVPVIRVRFSVLVVAVLATALDAPAFASGWSFGSNFGVGFDTREGADVTTTVGLPASPLALQPGARIGWLGSSPANEYFLDAGLLLFSETGATTTLLLATGNYQRNFAPAAEQSPFVSAGAGALLQGLPGTNTTSFVFGGGVGVRKWISDGHGTLRFELRADHIQSSQELSRPGVTVVSLRLGVDLWMARAHGAAGGG